jgi:release factor glutamine methyltransferase
MPTIQSVLDAAIERLKRVDVENPRLDARLILGSVLAADSASIVGYPERELTVEQLAQFDNLVDRRLARQPLSRILGRREFWGLMFRVTPDTLDPRPDSECLIDAVLERRRDRRAALRILDLGTGTGCLLLALLHEFPAATGLGIDNNAGALLTARGNAADLGLGERADFCHGNWTDGVIGPFDVIISNPPYIRSDDIETLMPEVARYDPRGALDGGRDGLGCYRHLGRGLANLMSESGMAVIEIGADQEQAASAILTSGGLLVGARRNDLAGRVRALVLERKND